MCQHLRTVGDNYGETCADCGEPLRGFGEWAEGSRECLHGLWYDNGDGTETCGYCEQPRVKEEKRARLLREAVAPMSAEAEAHLAAAIKRAQDIMREELAK